MTDTTTRERVTLTLEDADGHDDRNHYRATLKRAGKRATFSFNTGAAWERRPVAREVLESALSDAGLVRDADTVGEALEELEQQIGTQDDTPEHRRALAAACLTTKQKLERLLDDDYTEAMDDPDSYAWRVTDDPPEHISRSTRARGREWSGRIGAGPDGPMRVHIELTPKEQGLELTISGSTPHGGGQNLDELERLTEYAPGWDAERVARLREVWQRWHLNAMRAACEHQHAAGWPELAGEELTLYHWRIRKELAAELREHEKRAAAELRAGATVTLPPAVLELAALPTQVTTSSETPPRPEYEPNGPTYQGDHYNRPTETKHRGHVRPDEHPAGLLTAPCPECGYKYGTAWLFEELPADVLEWLGTIAPSLKGDHPH